jgi:hypothetical protein
VGDFGFYCIFIKMFFENLPGGGVYVIIPHTPMCIFGVRLNSQTGSWSCLHIN